MQYRGQHSTRQSRKKFQNINYMRIQTLRCYTVNLLRFQHCRETQKNRKLGAIVSHQTIERWQKLWLGTFRHLLRCLQQFSCYVAVGLRLLFRSHTINSFQHPVYHYVWITLNLYCRFVQFLIINCSFGENRPTFHKHSCIPNGVNEVN